MDAERSVHTKIPNIYLPMLLSFILADEVCSNYLYSNFAAYSGLKELFLFVAFIIIQIISSPIQAGYSDFYCRKKSLIISLSCSFLSVLLIAWGVISNVYAIPLFGLAILAKGALGNNLPLSWAAISDTQTTNFRFSLGLSTAAMATGYFILVLISDFFNFSQTILLLSLIFIALIAVCVLRFNDIRDMKHINQNDGNKKTFMNAIHMEIKLITNNFLKIQRTRKALLAFMLWEISFYTALIADADLKLSEFKSLSYAILSGYLFGVIILKFLSKKNDHQMIRLGFFLSVIALLPILLFSSLFEVSVLMMPCYFLYSLAAAFLAPSLFSILSKERGAHEQGKIYGLIDSTDTLAFLIACLFVIAYNSLDLKQIYLFIFSFLMFILSWVPYAQFKKSKS